MKTTKSIWFTLTQSVKQFWGLPKSWLNHGKNRRMYALRIKNENERIDRLRNPYLHREK